MEAVGQRAFFRGGMRRLALGAGIGAGAALLLSLLVNGLYGQLFGLSPEGLLARLLQGFAFRYSPEELFSEAMLPSGAEGGVIQGSWVLVLFALALVAFPLLFSFFGGRHGIANWLGLAVVFLLFSLTAILPQLSVSLGVISLGSALLAVFCVRRCKDEFFALAFCCGGVLASIMLAFGLFGVFLGENSFLLFTDTLARALGNFLFQISRASVIGDNSLPYYTPAQGQQLFLTAFFSLFFYASLLVGMGIFLLARMGARRAKELPFQPTPFTQWRLPGHFVGGMLALYLFGEIGKYYGWRHFNIVTSCFMTIITFAMAVQGFALLLYVARHMRSFWPMILVLVMSFSYGTIALTLVGLFEQCFNLRGRLQVLAVASYLTRRRRGGRKRNGDDYRIDAEDVNELMQMAEEMSPEDFARMQEELARKNERGEQGGENAPRPGVRPGDEDGKSEEETAGEDAQGGGKDNEKK